MTLHVVDASVFGPLFFEDEKDALFAGLDALIEEGDCIAPSHWRLEVTNQILSGLRRKRTTETMAEQAIAQIADFSIAVDSETGARCGDTYRLAQEHGLTIYDAAYLELAIRLRSPLVTYDTDLRRAARAQKIRLLPE